MNTILVIDVGRTRCRVSTVQADGAVVASAESDYLTGVLRDWVEQEPRDWWLALTLAMPKLKESAPDVTPTAIAVTGQSSIVLLADDADRLDAAILHEDKRATMEWQEMVARVGVETLLRSANIVHEDSSPIAKLLWLKKHAPSQYERARTLFLGAHDYIAWRLCGARVTDYTTASASDLFALQTNTWASDLLQSLDVRSDWFPTLVSAGAQIGTLSAAPAEKLGLPVGLPVFHAGADIAATLVGAGVHEPHHYACYLGESGWLATTGLSELANPVTGLLNLRDAERTRLLVTGPMITAAGNFEWLKDRFGAAEEKVFADANLSVNELLMTLAAEAAPGSSGVVYLPYLTGEQAPYRDPNARAGWFYISRRTFRSELYRSVLEGVAYSMRAIQMLIPEPAEEQPIRLRLIGNESATPLWCQIFADVFDCPVDVLTPADDVTARGAALYALRGLDATFGDLPNEAYLHIQTTYFPKSENVEIYDRMFGVFCRLYPALVGLFKEMAEQAE